MKLTQYYIMLISIFKKIDKIEGLSSLEYIMKFKYPFVVIDNDYRFSLSRIKHKMTYDPMRNQFIDGWHVNMYICDMWISDIRFGDKLLMNELRKHTIDNNKVRAQLSVYQDIIMDSDIEDSLKDKLCYFINNKNRQF